jgi:hypothetical protein
MATSLEEKQAELEKRRAQKEAQKQQILNQSSVRIEKKEMRLKILIGTGILEDLNNTIDSDINAYLDKISDLKSILNRTIHNESQRDFLKQYGYI